MILELKQEFSVKFDELKKKIKHREHRDKKVQHSQYAQYTIVVVLTFYRVNLEQ